MNILEIDDLSKSYDGKTNALHRCNFSLAEGRICAVVGESGSGKSTLLRLIAGLERPEAGSIRIAGKEVSSDARIVPPQKRPVGLVFQDFALFPHLTVGRNIAFGISDNKKAVVEELLQLVRMEGQAGRYPSELSGGQEQRVAIARTLARKPTLLLLDEPFSNLDTELKSDLRHEIRRIVQERNTTLLFITHDLYDAVDMADEIIFLKDGEVLQHSAIADFAGDADNEHVQRTISGLREMAERLLISLK